MSDQGVARVTVTVPKGIKARMDKVAENVNWSRIASDAFEAEVLKQESQMEVKTMDDVVARLKAAGEAESNEMRQHGYAVGAAWARAKATPKQLQNLTRELMDGTGQGNVDHMIELYQSHLNKGAIFHLYVAITKKNHENVDQEDAEHFFEKALGDEPVELMNDHDFACGFVDGATDVWEKVAARV